MRAALLEDLVGTDPRWGPPGAEAVLHVLESLSHVPDASKAAEDLRGTQRTDDLGAAARLVREVRAHLIAESAVDFWLADGHDMGQEFEAISDLASERSRQAQVLQEWLDTVAEGILGD